MVRGSTQRSTRSGRPASEHLGSLVLLVLLLVASVLLGQPALVPLTMKPLPSRVELADPIVTIQ